jgi:hypothetical protein
MRLAQIGNSWLLAAFLLLATVACDSNHPLSSDEPEPPDPIVVRLLPDRLAYRQGDTVVANVWIAKAENVGSVPFHLLYDRQVLEFLPPAIEGPFMSADGAFTIFLVADAGGGGELVVGLSRLGSGVGAYGAGLLASFEFKALSAGSSTFEFIGARVKDPWTRNLPSEFSALQLRVRP